MTEKKWPEERRETEESEEPWMVILGGSMNELWKFEYVWKKFKENFEKIPFDNMAQKMAENHHFLGNSERYLRVPTNVLVGLQPERETELHRAQTVKQLNGMKKRWGRRMKMKRRD